MSSVRSLAIQIVSPRAGHEGGNAVTARRWARLLRQLGHRAVLAHDWLGESCDVLVALHAVKSAPAVLRFRDAHPDRPVIVGLAGTDVYAGLARSVRGHRALDAASRIIALQALAAKQLRPGWRRKTRVILQSADIPAALAHRRPSRARAAFDICVLANLRHVKDPLRAALASRRLPQSSRIRVIHAGAALTDAMSRRALAEMARNARYDWRGELSRSRALRLLASSDALVLASRSEGGANVLSEAAALGVPVLCSRIDGSLGLLGPRHPGYFEVGDTEGLARLMHRAERDEAFVTRLRHSSNTLARLVTPVRELASWRRLLTEMTQ